MSPASSGTRRGLLGSVGAAVLAGCGGRRSTQSDEVSLPDRDWPTVGGGPAHTGFVPDATVPSAPTTEWSAHLGGWPHSPPVVADGTVVVAEPTRVRALSAADGTGRWRGDLQHHPSGAPGIDPEAGVVTVPTADPTTANAGAFLTGFDLATGDRAWRTRVDPEAVYAVTAVDGVAYARTRRGCVAVVDGAVRWRRDDLGKTGYESFGADDGMDLAGAVTPAVVDGTVYVPARNALVALDAADGTERWRVPVEHAFATPTVVEDTVYAVGVSEVAAVGTDGRVRWRSADHGGYGSAAVADDRVYVADDRLCALDAADGTERWTADGGQATASDSLVVGQMVCVHDGGLTAYDREPGRLTELVGRGRWQTDVETAGYSPVAVGAGRLFAVQPFERRLVALS